jgi:threonine 3-dehydrogenase
MNPTTPTPSAAPRTPGAVPSGTMRAVVKAKAGPGVEIREVPIPVAGPGQLLLRVLRAGICGTDLHIYEWDAWSQNRLRPPVVIGHEFVGEILARGPGITEFELGERVSFESHIVCGHCTACRTGNAHVCQKTSILGVDVNGGFAEYAVAPAVNAWRAPANVPLEVQSIMEPLGNAVHTAFSGDLSACRIAVTGCGPIGLFAIGVARAAGACQVIASDVSPYRLELARRMKADAVIDVSKEDFVRRVGELTDGRGLDGVLEMSGNAKAIRDGLEALRNGGRLSLLGLPREEFGLDWNKLLVFKGVTIHGIAGRRMYDTWYQMDNLLRTGSLDVLPAISHVMPMEKVVEGIELLRSGNAGKIVLVPWGQEA